MNKVSFQLGWPGSQLLLIAVLLVIGYSCNDIFRFSSHTLNSVFAYALYAFPVLAIRPVSRLAQRPRRWCLIFFAPVLLLSLLFSLVRYLGGSERTEALQSLQQARSIIELQRYERGGAIGVHGLNVEQRRAILPGLYVVRSIGFFYFAKEGSMSAESMYVVRVHARGSYGNNSSVVDTIIHIKPWVYF